MRPTAPFPADVRAFVASAPWRAATTYAATWPHEYIVRNDENAKQILAADYRHDWRRDGLSDHSAMFVRFTLDRHA